MSYNEILAFFKETKNFNLTEKSWFKDIWYPLFEEKNIVITDAILSFFFEDWFQKENMFIKEDNFDISFKPETMITNFERAIGIHNIEYQLIDLELYNYVLKRKIKEKKYISMSIQSFKEFITLFEKKDFLLENYDPTNVKKYFISLENMLSDYRKHLYKEELNIVRNELESTTKRIKK